ncbi:hypothetical protein [Halorhabdus amylolytica]|uniref:hypothetical protein n=1 Tax=Halorhabdus amylolytica TaxID=2559573 RepID=UPI0010AA60B7|nr:hypothetical protein [Halorhabdus amylolytica]
MIEVIEPYAVTASAAITATAAVGAFNSLRDFTDRLDETERRSIANQRRQIGEPDEPETLDEPILDRVRDLEGS